MTIREVKADSVMVQRPTFGATLLHKCAGCSAPHPMARMPPIESSTCPDCGTNVTRPDTIYGPAILRGWHPLTLLARLMFWVSDGLLRLSHKLQGD